MIGSSFTAANVLRLKLKRNGDENRNWNDARKETDHRTCAWSGFFRGPSGGSSLVSRISHLVSMFVLAVGMGRAVSASAQLTAPWTGTWSAAPQSGTLSAEYRDAL